MMQMRNGRAFLQANTVFLVHELTDLAHFRDPSRLLYFEGKKRREEKRKKREKKEILILLK
jgi:hypothetical protein